MRFEADSTFAPELFKASSRGESVVQRKIERKGVEVAVVVVGGVCIWHHELMWKKQVKVVWQLSENGWETRGSGVFEHVLCMCGVNRGTPIKPVCLKIKGGVRIFQRLATQFDFWFIGVTSRFGINTRFKTMSGFKNRLQISERRSRDSCVVGCFLANPPFQKYYLLEKYW